MPARWAPRSSGALCCAGDCDALSILLIVVARLFVARRSCASPCGWVIRKPAMRRGPRRLRDDGRREGETYQDCDVQVARRCERSECRWSIGSKTLSAHCGGLVRSNGVRAINEVTLELLTRPAGVVRCESGRPGYAGTVGGQADVLAVRADCWSTWPKETESAWKTRPIAPATFRTSVCP